MRDLALSAALATVGDDLHYTAVRLASHPDTQPLAGDFANYVAQVDSVAEAHKGLLRGIAKADANAAGARVLVEAFVTGLQVTALGVCKQDRTDPRFRTLFPEPASAIVDYGEAKLRQWLDGVGLALAKLQEPELVAEAGAANMLLADWDALQAAQAAAATANAQHDASVRTPLRATVNAARRDLHADLTKLATKTKRDRRWVESFFRAAARGKAPGGQA